MQEQKVTLKASKETKNCIKYDEVEVPGQPPIVRNIYLPKWLSPPKTIVLTIKASD